MTCAVTDQAGCGSDSVAAWAITVRPWSSIEEIRTRTAEDALATHAAAPIAFWPPWHDAPVSAEGVIR